MDTFIGWTHKHDFMYTNTQTLSQQIEVCTANSFDFCCFESIEVASTYFVQRQTDYDPVRFELRRIFDMLRMLV